jgi:ATP-dependent DNA helicase RecG
VTDQEMPLIPSTQFESRLVVGATLEDLDPVLVDRFRPRSSRQDRASLLRNLGMAAEDESGGLQPTGAGVLLAGRAPEHWLPQACIEAVLYRGSGELAADPQEQTPLAEDLRAVATGPLDAQILAACEFVRRNMRREGARGFGCLDVPQYDLAAVFEGVVNAVAHRDYTSLLPVRLAMFDDHLEIASPGDPFLGFDIDANKFWQASRNATICKLLSSCRVAGQPNTEVVRTTFMRSRGEGLPMLRRRTEQLAGKCAEFSRLGASQVVLRMPAATAAQWGFA